MLLRPRPDELHMALVSPICAIYKPTEERVTNRGKQIPRVADKEDRKILAGKTDSYIYGWNKVKYGQKTK